MPFPRWRDRRGKPLREGSLVRCLACIPPNDIPIYTCDQYGIFLDGASGGGKILCSGSNIRMVYFNRLELVQ